MTSLTFFLFFSFLFFLFLPPSTYVTWHDLLLDLQSSVCRVSPYKWSYNCVFKKRGDISGLPRPCLETIQFCGEEPVPTNVPARKGRLLCMCVYI